MQNTGQLDWRHAIDPKHVNGLSVITQHHRTAIARPPPQALPSERKLPIRENSSYVRVKKLELVYRGSIGTRRELRIKIYRLNDLAGGQGVRRNATSGLLLAPYVRNPATPCGVRRKAIHRAPSLAVWATEIV